MIYNNSYIIFFLNYITIIIYHIFYGQKCYVILALWAVKGLPPIVFPLKMTPYIQMLKQRKMKSSISIGEQYTR